MDAVVPPQRVGQVGGFGAAEESGNDRSLSENEQVA